MNGRATRRRVRVVRLTVEWLDDGGLRFTAPDMPGWAYVARSPRDLVRGLEQARVEAEVAAYARWRGTVYDQQDVPGKTGRDDQPPRPRSRGQRKDVLPLESWTPLPDGSWVSPSGQRWRPNTRLARTLTQRAREKGLPAPP